MCIFIQTCVYILLTKNIWKNKYQTVKSYSWIIDKREGKGGLERGEKFNSLLFKCYAVLRLLHKSNSYLELNYRIALESKFI